MYASILTRMERSELQKWMNEVMEKEMMSIDRHLRHASSSLTALRQLQAAAGQLRPSDDWLLRTLSVPLTSIEAIQCQLETVMDDIETDRTTKKRKRPMKRRTMEEMKKKKDEIVIGDEEEESFVDRKMKVERIEAVNNGLEIVERDKSEVLNNEKVDVEELAMESGGERTEMERTLKYREESNNVESETVEEQQDDDDDDETDVKSVQMMTADEGMTLENVELEIPTDCGNKRLDDDMERESGKLPNGIVKRPLDVIVHVKEEPVTLDDVQTLSNDEGRSCRNYKATAKIATSPIKLEINDSLGKIAVKLEVSELTELALELEVPDSDTDDEFSPIQDLVAKLQRAKRSTQLTRVPVAVDQLRTYLFDRKYLTVAGEMDEYLFAHKCITNEEANVIGHTIETIISVAINLPNKATIKFALYDLLATVEQLELTLGELPEFLHP